ncbi:MAG: hypothetical protein QXR85_00265 [Candidatus Micrarchaeaceae archaeon]
MRILVLSNVPRSVDAVVNGLGSNSIVAKEVNVQSGELADIAANELGNGYDVCVVMAKDPILVSMVLNKKEGIMAAVCNSAADVALGKSSNANVFVIRDPKSQALGEITSAISKLGYNKGFFKLQLPKFQSGLPGIQQQAQQAQQAKKQQKQKSEEIDDESEGQDNDNETGSGSSGKGLLGKIKNALGII